MADDTRPTRAEYSEALARYNSGDYLNYPASLVNEDYDTITRYRAAVTAQYHAAITGES